jgi:hypothetical protein
MYMNVSSQILNNNNNNNTTLKHFSPKHNEHTLLYLINKYRTTNDHRIYNCQYAHSITCQFGYRCFYIYNNQWLKKVAYQKSVTLVRKYSLCYRIQDCDSECWQQLNYTLDVCRAANGTHIEMPHQNNKIATYFRSTAVLCSSL